MADDRAAAAAARLEAALAGAAIADPRPAYRDHLRALRGRDPDAFGRASRVYEAELLPGVARTASDPVAEWLAYGGKLAELTGPGRFMAIDAEGRARRCREPLPRDRLVLYLPEAKDAPVFPVLVPASLSPAQQASLDLLVAGRTG
jgi:hypothetical protein